MKRNYLSIYFPFIDEHGTRHTKNVCIAFNEKETPLFEKMQKLKTKDIKKAISIFTYKKLIECSEKENRKPTELIKMILAEKLIQKGRHIKRTIEFSPAKVKKWIKILKTKKIDSEIAEFLTSVIESK